MSCTVAYYLLIPEMNIIKKIIKYSVIFLIALFLLTTVLVLTALIPKKLIYKNMLSSAEYLCENNVFFKLEKGSYRTKIDRYADSILLSIVYHTDGEHPLYSVMRCEYYHTDEENENKNLRESIIKGYAPNQQYLRYWHGSAAAVRVMHIFTDIRGMYIFNAILLAVLFAALTAYLIRCRLYGGAVGLIAALAAVGVQYVPYSLEYTWVFLIMPVVTFIAVRLVLTEKYGCLAALFLLSGMITNYMDFLTTETLTLTIPLLMAVYTDRKREISAAKVISLCVLWFTGYGGMWACKWLLAAAITRENVLSSVTEHIAERAGNLPVDLLPETLRDNIYCLFPLCEGGAGVLLFIAAVIAGAYVCYVYKKDTIEKQPIIILFILGAIPLVRYIVLRNHSYLHYFFTYRAMASSVLAVCLIVGEIADRKLIKKEFGRKFKASGR